MIDFYTGHTTDPTKPVALHLDVRPALDSLEAVQDRVTRGVGEWVTGLRKALPVLGKAQGEEDASAPKAAR